MSLLLTCDTGGWKTPTRLRDRLAPAEDFSGLQVAEPDLIPTTISLPTDRLSRRGVDREAYFAARKLAHHGGSELICNEFRSDLVDVGRSLHHRDLFPPQVRALPVETRDAIIEEIYHPYRNRVQQRIAELLQTWSYVVHLSVRTFDAKTTGGDWQRGDLGLLYDPARKDELDWCLDLFDELFASVRELKVRRNHPHRGTNDSLTKSMRAEFPPDRYLGVELTLNRAWVSRPVIRREKVLERIGRCIGRLANASIERAA
ncbi:N-formylglutamate amidohydrolase [Neorhodopirellula pilleata]|uniref:N-formylglutamate amidohydrolase n=1 Tax=Neorhodopirellula pilleata TaxID=2714738 RepID=A0A5C6AST7_9BACT|nr:N-formylglutamate amidohydrolase [Neorhodopirellula pilleata]TWU02052.1 N-formylglutamate amidohydrolase [Neorhodopirellula pilleata]